LGRPKSNHLALTPKYCARIIKIVMGAVRLFFNHITSVRFRPLFFALYKAWSARDNNRS